MVNRRQSVSPFLQAIRDHMTVVGQLENQLELFEQVADRMIRDLRAGNKILRCGTAVVPLIRSILAEIVGRFWRERRAGRRSRLPPTLPFLPPSAMTTGTKRYSPARFKPSVKPAT
jgi:hypothetical protein